jgi:hypothetical protein
VEFVALVEALHGRLNSDEYREEVISGLREQYEGEALGKEQPGSALELVKQQMPLFGIILDWFWLIQSLVLVSPFLFLGNVVVKPLAGLYGLVVERLI